LLTGKSASWLINSNLAAAGLVLTAASFVDLGNIAAWWNVRHAREVGGSGAALDLCYLSRLDSSSLLPLIALEQRTDLKPAFRERVQSVRASILRNLRHQMESGWTMRGERRLKQAEQLVQTLQPIKVEPSMRNCDGSVVPPPPLIEIPSPAKPAAPSEAEPTAPVPAAKPASALTAEARK
jgi:hypothetical protein